jgi:hypothetical protein
VHGRRIADGRWELGHEVELYCVLSKSLQEARPNDIFIQVRCIPHAAIACGRPLSSQMYQCNFPISNNIFDVLQNASLLPPFPTDDLCPSAAATLSYLRQQYHLEHSLMMRCVTNLRSTWLEMGGLLESEQPFAKIYHTGCSDTVCTVDGVSIDHRECTRSLQTELDPLRAHVLGLEDNFAAATSKFPIAKNDPCSTAVSNGMKRQDASFLRQVFDKHKDASGSIPAAALAEALVDADAPVIPDSITAVEAAISRFDVNRNGVVKFGEFLRFVSEPDDLALYFQERHAPALADALRAVVGRGSDQLLRTSQLSSSEILAASAAVCRCVPDQALKLHEQLQRSFTAQFELQAQLQADCNKFNVVKMACGSIEDFHAGLTSRVGMPHLDFQREMMREHCERAGCNKQFTTGNYGITTTPRQEWLYTAGDEQGHRMVCPAEDMRHGRRISPLDELMQLPLAVHAGLTQFEVLALVLYTGPMFHLYNLVLRRYPVDAYTFFEEGGNKFATTIFVLVSAITKVAKCTWIPEGTLLYRGLGGLLDLPDRFFSADSNGASGYADWGFMSTSSDRDVALGYSGVKQRRPKAMVMVIEATSVDKGADISLFSQYPGEKEFLWVPCSFVQRAQQSRGRVEIVDGGLVLFMPVRVNLNLKTETVEELREKKKRLHLVSARSMVEEVRFELGEWAAGAKALERMQLDVNRNQGGVFSPASLANAVVKQCEAVVQRHEAADVNEYVDDSAFRVLVSEMLDTKDWAKQKVRLWTDNPLQFIGFLQGCSLRHCHRMWQSFLRKSISRTTQSSERVALCLELLISRGLVKRSVSGDLNADGEDVIVQAGGDGWVAGDIVAAVAAGADLHATDGNGCTGIWNAARYGHEDSLIALLAAGGEVNKCSNQGASPLYFAAANGHSACIAQLLSFGGNVNICNTNGSSPIFTAAASGYHDIVKQLAAAGGDVNLCHRNGASPIFAASEHGYAECISQLVSFGADINRCRNDGTSPICIAAQNGHAPCVAQLLSYGANKPDIISALERARQQCHSECVRLIEAVLL